MARQPGCFDVDDPLAELWAKGDNLERLNAVVDFERSARILSGRFRASIAKKEAGHRSIMCSCSKC